MATGKIVKLHPNKYGFISPLGSVKRLFFHFSELRDLVFDDDLLHQIVDFDAGENEKGPLATNIRAARPPAHENHQA